MSVEPFVEGTALFSNTFPSSTNLTDTTISTKTVHVSKISTIGTASTDMANIKLLRSTVNDTFDDTVYALGVKIFWTADALNDD